MNELFIKVNIYEVTGLQAVSLCYTDYDVVPLLGQAYEELSGIAKNLFYRECVLIPASPSLMFSPLTPRYAL